MYTLKIEDKIEVPVKFGLSGGAVHNVVLLCRRRRQAELASLAEINFGDFMGEVTFGWKNQRLVEDEQGQPAEFSPEALQTLFTIPGVSKIAFESFAKENSATAKN